MVENAGELELNKMNKQWWFATPVWFWDVPRGQEINQRLIPHIMAWRKQDEKGVVRSNVLGWHSPDNLHRRPEFAELIDIVAEAAQQCHADWKIKPSFAPLVDNCWANVSPKYAYNRMHTHPGVVWSGVYYVRCPSCCGNILFTDPRPQAHVMSLPLMETGPETWSTVKYEPVEGRMLLFPSWLMHEVEPNLSAEPQAERISISFNIALRQIDQGAG